MKLLYILNGLGFSAGMPIGGADKRALEVGKYLRAQGWSISFLTTDAGEEVLRQHGGTEFTFLTVRRPFFWPKFLENNLLGRVLSYFYVILADFLSNFQLPTSNFRIIYPTSDMFFDLLPAFFLKLRCKKVKLAGIVHHYIPPPWRREGSFLANLLLWLSQRFGFLLLRVFADLVFYPQTDEGALVKKVLRGLGLAEGRLFPFRNGVNIEEAMAAPAGEKKYAAVFLGGLRPSKGLYDLVPIWRLVQSKLPGAKLLIVGGGLGQYEEELKRAIKKEGLEGLVMLAGVVAQPGLFTTMKEGEIFISPSHEEGWGIVVGEALACGLAVVAYDLPAYRPYGKVVEKVPLGDVTLFAQKVIRLLQDSGRRRRKVEEGYKIIQSFGWEAAAAREKELL